MDLPDWPVLTRKQASKAPRVKWLSDIGRPYTATETRDFGDKPLATPVFATIRSRFLRIRLRPDLRSPEIGLLRDDATAKVTACQPGCAAPHAWALRGADGALDLLVGRSNRAEAPATSSAESLWCGGVGKTGVRKFRQPRPEGPVLTRKQIGGDTINPDAAGLSALWVRIDKRTTRNIPSPTAARQPSGRREAS